jgi:hypothetical protein
MRCGPVIPFVAGLLLVMWSPAHAQDQRPLAAVPLQFESWRLASSLDSTGAPTVSRLVVVSRDRGDQALLGGIIGAAAGVVSCTVISTFIDDSAEGGLSFCPLDTYLYFAGGGFVLGAIIGWLI